MTDNDLIKASIEKEIDNLMSLIVNDCNELKKNCKTYNPVGELTDLITQLEAEASLLASVGAKQTCQQFVNSLKQLVDSLMADPNLSQPCQLCQLCQLCQPIRTQNSQKKSRWFGW